MSKIKRPCFKAFPTYYREFKTGSVALWCPWCETWHYHGAKGVIATRKLHKVAHCQEDDSPLHEGGYYIKMVSKEDLRRLGIKVLPGYRRGLTYGE